MAYAQLATKLAVTNGTDAYLQPFSMAGSNAARFGVTVFTIGAATGVAITPQGSNDGQNWDPYTASGTLVVGYSNLQTLVISHAMVRLKVAVVGTGTVVLAADAWTSQQ
jgi:hypothetical protein